MHKMFFGGVGLLFFTLPLSCFGCEWWDAACHAREGSGVFKPIKDAGAVVKEGADKVVKTINDTVQTGKDIAGGMRTLIEIDPLRKLAGVADVYLDVKDQFFSEDGREKSLKDVLMDDMKKASDSLQDLPSVIKRIDDFPDTVTPADLGKEVVIVSDKLSAVNKMSNVTNAFADLMRKIDPLIAEMLNIMLRFAQNSGRTKMEAIYIQRVKQSQAFFQQMPVVLRKIGTEWDRLAPEITTAIKGAGQLLESMSGMIVFALKLGNMTTKDLLNKALKGNAAFGPGVLNASVGLPAHTLSLEGAVNLPVDLWNTVNDLSSEFFKMLDYGLDVLIPSLNRAFLLVDAKLDRLAQQEAGFAKTHTIAEILSYLNPLFLNIVQDKGFLEQMLTFLEVFSHDVFALIERTTWRPVDFFEFGPRLRGIDEKQVEELINTLKDIRKSLLPVLEGVDTNLPQIIDMLEPLARIHTEALGEKF